MNLEEIIHKDLYKLNPQIKDCSHARYGLDPEQIETLLHDLSCRLHQQ